MNNLDNNHKAFFELLRVGLWTMPNQEFSVQMFKDVDWEKVYLLAREQSVQGLVLQGIEALREPWLKDLETSGTSDQGQAHGSPLVPKRLLLQWIGAVQKIEKRNKAMNVYLAMLIDKLQKHDIYAILVKGQGIAQCYERPLWRASGDIDLLLSEDNYEKAKQVLLPLAKKVEKEYKTIKHIGMTMAEGFVVELHGNLHSRLSKSIDNTIDKAQTDIFNGGNVQAWENGRTTVYLPSPDNDVIFVFTHILHHFYIEGIGLRQVCDWCRLLWTYRESLNHRLLETRIRKAGIMTEWSAFGAFVVEYLGMPKEAMPCYDASTKWKKKAQRINEFILEVGNFGHNRKISGGKRNSAFQKVKDFARHAKLFPMDSVKFFCHFLVDGIRLMIK